MALELEDASAEVSVRFRGETERNYDVGGSGDFVNVGVSEAEYVCWSRVEYVQYYLTEMVKL